MNNRLINTKVAGGGGGCTDIVDEFDPFGGGGLALYQLNGDATDVSGNYDGNFVNASYTTGVFGQAGVFDSNSKYMNAASPIGISAANANDDITVSVWINFNSVITSGAVALFGVPATNTTSAFHIYLYGHSDGLAISFERSFDNKAHYADGYNTQMKYPFVAGVWYNLVVTYIGSTKVAKAYVNGSQVPNPLTLIQRSTNANTVQTIRMGLDLSNASINASIDQVRIFNTALTPLEIEALYKEELCICDGTVDTLQILGDTSCIATYQLDGNANDLSGNYSGTPTDVSYGVGEFDLAGVFNGSTSRILNTVTATSITSFSMWVKINDTNTAQMIQTFGNNEYLVSVYLGKLNVQYAATSTSGIGWTITNQSNWHHIAGTITSNSATLYVDGQQKTDTFADYFNGQSVGCIGDRDSGDANFNGSIDQVRIFNRAITAGEVETLWLESACTYGGRQSEGTQILGGTSCIAYYKLDGTADDETGTYDGTFTNPNYGNGEFLYGGVFDGSSSYVSGLPTLTNVSSEFSVSLWLKYTTNPSSGFKYVFGGIKEQGSNDSIVGIVVNDSGNIGYFTRGSNSSTLHQIVSSADFTNGWHNVVISSDSTSMSLYVDGDNIDTLSVSPTITVDNSVLGAINSRGTIEEHFPCLIDQIRVFNKAVSPSEVTTLYNEGI